MRIAMIAAVAENGIIGASGRIPWRAPSDMAFFKRTTIGKPIVMGRKQFETVGRPLPGRTNIIVSRRPGYQPDGVIVINDLPAALEHARTLAEADGATEAMVIGGGEIYAQALPFANRLYISHIAASPEGDTRFPAIDRGVWTAVAEPEVPRTGRDEVDFRTVIYERRPATSH